MIVLVIPPYLEPLKSKVGGLIGKTTTALSGTVQFLLSILTGLLISGQHCGGLMDRADGHFLWGSGYYD